jgi:hypothetical protein
MTLSLVSSCEGCGRSGNLEQIRGETFHRGCAPSHWVRDLEDLERFMSKVRQRHLFELLEPDDPFKRRPR